MPIARVTPGLFLLLGMMGLCGCSQTGALRMATATDNLKTTASVGDRALPIVAGEPGGSLRVDTADPEMPRSARGRISGRVYDEEGRPVPNARVRLAVGALPAGKAVYSTTDRSGAYTIGGLRPGSSYTVIAEYQGEQGMMSGRAEADAPDADARIALHLRDAGIGPEADVRTASRPHRSNVKPISRIEPIDDEAYEDEPEPEPRRATATVNREDLAPPAEDDAVELSRVEPRRGWSSGSRASKPTRIEPMFEDDGAYEEGNPLPPARELDVAEDQDQDRDAPPTPRTGEMGPVAEAPRPLPDEFPKDRRAVRSRASAPLPLNDPDAAPARSVRRRPRVEKLPDVPDDDPQVFQEPEPQPRPTWSELVGQAGSIPLDEAVVRTTTRSVAPQLEPIATTVNRPAANRAVRSLAPSLLPRPITKPFCDFDASDQRLIDFALPDANGRLVAISDLGADLILLDFWGTWCEKCITSIPHLRELQARLGGKRLQVVGIACEQTPADARTAKVAAVAKKLDINYTVLITAMDGTCPVQDAFQIRYYPTMILLDRNGRTLCRVEGATPETLGRLDRYIAKNLDREPSTRPLAVSARAAGRR